MERLQFYAFMPFMLHMPYSTCFYAGKYKQRQKINQSAKAHSLVFVVITGCVIERK